MKIFLPFIIVICITLTSIAESGNWIVFERSWDKYIAQPTHENAVEVYKQLPNELLTKDLPEVRLVNKMYEGWPHLSKKIAVGNKDAIEIGFKLYAIVDGGFKEDVGADLGKLITLDAKLFLQELKKHRHLVQNLDGIVCNYGQEYADRKDLQIEEKDNRMRLLVNVSDPNLEEVKAECLKVFMDEK